VLEIFSVKKEAVFTNQSLNHCVVFVIWLVEHNEKASIPALMSLDMEEQDRF